MKVGVNLSSKSLLSYTIGAGYGRGGLHHRSMTVRSGISGERGYFGCRGSGQEHRGLKVDTPHSELVFKSGP